MWEGGGGGRRDVNEKGKKSAPDPWLRSKHGEMLVLPKVFISMSTRVCLVLYLIFFF